MSEDRRDKELRQELERLGEPGADAEEIAAAERLAARLEGALHVVDTTDDGDLSTLAETLRDGGRDASAGALATDRALARIFADADPGAQESPADELEQRRADALATGVDRMIAGVLPLDAPAEVRDLLHVVAMIRVAAHATPLSSGRLETLVDQAYGAEQTAAEAAPAAGRTSAVLRLALVAALAVLVMGAGLVMGGYLGPRPVVSAGQQLPTHLTSRSTRDILPGAFPRSQTSTARINLIYHDRMRSFRELQLGGPHPPSPARRKP